MLDFGDNEEKVVAGKHIDRKPEVSAEVIAKWREAKELRKKQAQLEKAESKAK